MGAVGMDGCVLHVRIWVLEGHGQNIMDWMFVSLQNSYVEALTSNVTVFGNKAFIEVTEVKWSYNDGATIL